MEASSSRFECHATFSSSLGCIDDVAFSQDGKFLATACTVFEGNFWRGGLHFLRAGVLECVASCVLRTGVTGVCWASSDCAVAATDEGSLRVVKLAVEDQQEHASFTAGQIEHTELSIQKSKDVSATAIQPPLPIQRAPSTAAQLGAPYYIHDDIVSAVACSQKARNIILSSSWDGTLRKSDVLAQKSDFVGRDSSSIRDVACHDSNPNLVVSGSSAGVVVLWDLRIAKTQTAALCHLPSGIQSVTFASESLGSDEMTSTSVLAGTESGSIAALDPRNFGTPFSSENDVHTGPVFTVAGWREGSITRFASGGGDGKIKLRQLTERKEDTNCLTHIAEWQAHKDYVQKIIPTQREASGASFISCSWDGTVKLWHHES